MKARAILFIVALVFITSIGIYYLYEKREVGLPEPAALNVDQGTTSGSVVAPMEPSGASETANWDTFENKYFKYSLKHPAAYSGGISCFGGEGDHCIPPSYAFFWNFEIVVHTEEAYGFYPIFQYSLKDFADTVFKYNTDKNATLDTLLTEEKIGDLQGFSFITDGAYYSALGGYRLTGGAIKHVFLNDGTYNYEISFPAGHLTYEEMLHTFAFDR